MLNPLHKLALETIEMNKQAIIFAPSRASAEKTAEEISKLTQFQYPEFEKEALKAASTPTKQCRRLSHCLRKGIAFHHAGLLAKQKDLIEEQFKLGKIKIIAATPTLAAGLSLPAFRVIIASLKRYSGSWGMDWIPVLEYLQMAGRAGRPEYESYGEAITLAKSEHEKEEIYETYVLGKPEEIYSKLAVEPVLRTYLLSLISSGIIKDEMSMQNFFSRTFWAHQFEDLKQLNLIMEKMLLLLEGWKFVKINSDENRNENKAEFRTAKEDFVAASDLNSKEKWLRPTLLGKRISELYLDPLTATHLIDCLKNFNPGKNTFSLLQMISHTLEMRPLLRIKSKEQDKIQEELVKNYEQLLKPEPSAFDLEYGEFMNSIKTALFFEAWINEKDEDYLMETCDIRPGEIRIKLEIADWLLYAGEELSKILNYREALNELRKLRIRIKNGVKEDLLPLIKLKNIGRVRARKLINNGVKDLGGLKRMDLATLTQILGEAVAKDVKEQLGEEIKEIS